MKIVWKIVSRLLLTVALLVYIVIALVNYSLVQSYAGALAGDYFSREWGGKIHIGSLHAMPIDHLILDDVLWVSPTGDTILVAEKIAVGFEHFPYRNKGLDLTHVLLKNTYYHLAVNEEGINLKFLIDYYKNRRKEKEDDDEPSKPFTVKAKVLELDNVHYKMDLKDHRETVYPYGVQIPHMDFREIHAKIRDVHVENDDVRCRIIRFKTEEQSGFRLEELSGQVHVNRYEIVAKDFHIKTGASTIETDAELHYNTWKGISGYVSTVQQNATLRAGTRVSMSDVAYWAPVLWGIDAVAEAEGTAWGTVDSLTTDMMVHWGDNSSALVAGTVVGLPRIDTTEFDLNIEHLRTNKRDLSPLLEVMHLSGLGKELVDEMEYVNMSATVKGGFRDRATVNMLVDTKMGQVTADMMMQNLSDGYRFAIETGSDGLGVSIVGDEWLSRTGFDLTADGHWSGSLKQGAEWAKRLDITLDGHLTNSVVQGHALSMSTIGGELHDGRLTATLVSTDTLADVDLALTARLADSIKSYSADVYVERLDIGLLPRPLSTHLTVNLRGNSLDEMNGRVSAAATRYGATKVNQIALAVESDEKGKSLTLQSNLADVSLDGSFRYSDLPVMARHFMTSFLPEIFNPRTESDTALASLIDGNLLSFKVDWNDNGTILHTLAENVTIAQGTRLSGQYNPAEHLKLAMRSQMLKFGPIVLNNVGMHGRQEGDLYELQMETDKLNVGDMELMSGVVTTVTSKPERGTVELEWGDTLQTSRGDVMLCLEGDNMSVLKQEFIVGETPWELDAENVTLSNDKRLCITADHIGAKSKEQKIDARLSLNGQPNDQVELRLEKFSLDLLSDLFLQGSPVTLKGDIGGHIALAGLNETPYFNANIAVDSCQLNGQALGRVELTSNGNAELNMLNINLRSQQINAGGWVELGRKNTMLNLNIDFNHMEMAIAAPLLASFSNRFEGQLDGSLDIRGSLSQPMIVGEATVIGGALAVDITGVTYSFSDTLFFQDNTVMLRDFTVYDPDSNTAVANGSLSIEKSQLMIDIDMQTDNIIVLNQKSGDQFYGRLLASADAQVSGPVDDLDIAVQARTNPGCELTVPVNNRREVKSQNFITFVGGDTVAAPVLKDKDYKSPFNLTLDLAITPDMKLNLPMDFEDVTVDVASSGSGDLHMNLSGNASPHILGSYEILSGTMKLGLLSLYEKKFAIENGSSLNFQGAVPNARFDIKAVYSQRVNLSTLTGSLSALDNTQKYIQVENVIAIAGTLKDPSIGFDIRLPNADPSVEEEVFAYIDRNSERDMLTQTLSLLTSGSFSNVNNNNYNQGGSALDVVTSLVGNSLSDMVQFVDVNIDYRSATDYTNQQIDVNISKDWGRWYLESTLGYGGTSRELEANTVNGAVIDALLGYRITPMFHLYAYNRTNTNDYTRMDLPYKQGAGLKLTKDFDRWRDLFKHKAKKGQDSGGKKQKTGKQ